MRETIETGRKRRVSARETKTFVLNLYAALYYFQFCTVLIVRGNAAVVSAIQI